jgi:hypothetical protein
MMDELFSIRGISVVIFWIFGSYTAVMYFDRYRLFKNTTTKQKRGLKRYGATTGLIALAAGLAYIYLRINPMI